MINVIRVDYNVTETKYTEEDPWDCAHQHIQIQNEDLCTLIYVCVGIWGWRCMRVLEEVAVA